MRTVSFLLALVTAAFAFALVRAQKPMGLDPRRPISPLPAISSGDSRKISLGRDLFLDRRMSTSQRLNCASCHELETNGASSEQFDRGDKGGRLRFNTPTVFNSVFSFRLGWEGKTRTLRDLALGTLRTEHLMSGSGIPARRLAKDPQMTKRFRDLYGTAPNDEAIADALASFLTTLVTPDAPFDRWLRGEQKALSPQQVRGYERFKLLGCASCHQGINVGANIFQRRGIFHPLGQADPLYIRVPSLRNVAVTAPYFHDGSMTTLPEAIRQMALAQLDLRIAQQDIDDIASFLNALTGQYHGQNLRPAQRPKR